MSANEENPESTSTEVEVTKNPWVQLAFRLPTTLLLHPFEYAKILIQLGYEPVPPRASYTFLGRPALSLPNIFEYFGIIRRRVGIVHMYRGVVPRLFGVVSHSIVHREVSRKTAYLLNSDENADNEDSENEIADQNDRVLHFFQVTARNMVAQGAAVIVSHPFQVVTVRMVAQFIGGEEAYKWMYTSFVDIYKESGITGFFSGLIPRLLGEMLSLWICSCLTFVFNTYLVRDPDLRSYTGAVMSLVSSTVTYPYVLVSRVMMVNGSGMMASVPPNMPIYDGWTDCWNQLKAHNQLKRGSSLLWRYYTGPVVLKDGKPQAVTLRNFQRPVASRY